MSACLVDLTVAVTEPTWSKNAFLPVTDSTLTLSLRIEPFCCDTLQFEQWLQFVLIPKLHHILALNQTLPANASIAPMGEHLWQSDPTKHKLIGLLKQLDDCFNEA